MHTVEEKVVSFFQTNKQHLLHNWATNINETNELILKNGEEMLNLVLSVIASSANDEKIIELAKKVACERAKAGANIAHLLQNVNLGRSEIFKYINEIPIEIDELQEVINTINVCFDKFILHAVTAFMEVKDNIIEEKNQFISETHQDRLTILGQMASSYVHECRNPLTSVMGFVQLIQKEYPSTPYLDIVENELKQLEFRISQFLLLSKKELVGKQKETFYIVDLIQEVIAFLYPSIVDHNINIELKQYPVLFKGYKDEIKQVLVNIIFNSIDALIERQGNRNIIIDVYPVQDGFDIAIVNNGPKIPEKSLSTIFEPFVTTKQLGTGLGLFVCQEIMTKHGGQIYCESNEKETKFTIQFLDHLP